VVWAIILLKNKVGGRQIVVSLYCVCLLLKCLDSVHTVP
jgi:hypothetical protein